MAAQYIISRSIDPIFAASIGIAALIVRVRREEKEKGKNTQDTLDSLKHRFNLAWNGDDAKTRAIKT